MDRNTFLGKLASIFDAGLQVVEAKNKDYAGESDPFKNFRSSEIVNIPVEKAIMVRILDKTARIGNLLDRENVVVDEKVEDTILDVINYYAILKVYLETEKPNVLVSMDKPPFQE